MADYIWNGTGDWNTTGNWSPGGSPGTVDTAEIQSGTADVSGSDFFDVSSLTVDSGAAVTIEGQLTVGDGHLNGVPNALSIAGSLTVDNGALIVGGFVTSATGTVVLGGFGTLQWNGGQNVGGADATGLTVDMGQTGGTTFQFSQAFDGTITNFFAGDILTYTGTGTVNGITLGANSAVFSTSAGNFTINFDPSVNTADMTISGNTILSSQIVCFVSGTRILTTRGDVAVEELKAGDLAVTATGRERPIVWIGHRRIERPVRSTWPVRVRAGAFGDNLPARDLLLSGGHAVCVDLMGEIFVPIGELTNGATILREERTEVTYWHVELESHDVLVAEGLGCESYMDAGNRAFFGKAYGRLVEVDATDRVAESLTRYARPFVDRGVLVEAIRERLIARAMALGWSRAADMDLHMLVDGKRVEGQIAGDLARFIFPASASKASLTSRTFSPGSDTRALGVRIESLRISDGLRTDRDVALDGLVGLHPEEGAEGCHWRWTDGHLDLPAALWAACKGHVILRLTGYAEAGRPWLAPEADVAERRAA